MKIPELFGSGFTIPATAGVRTFLGQQDVLNLGLDPLFNELGTNVGSSDRPEVVAEVYTIVDSGSFPAIVDTLGLDLDYIFCRSQDRILSLLEYHPEVIGDEGHALFVPWSFQNIRYTLRFLKTSNGIDVLLKEFDTGFRWVNGYRRRLAFIPEN